MDKQKQRQQNHTNIDTGLEDLRKAMHYYLDEMYKLIDSDFQDSVEPTEQAQRLCTMLFMEFAEHVPSPKYVKETGITRLDEIKISPARYFIDELHLDKIALD